MRSAVRRLAGLFPLLAAPFAASCSGDAIAAAPQPGDCARLSVPGTPVDAPHPQAGQALLLPSATAICLPLPGSAADEYALAYADARAIEASRTAQEPARMDGFTVTVSAAGPASANRLPLSVNVDGAFRADVAEAPRGAVITGGDPRTRATPWSEGEDFALYDFERSVTRPARVQRVYGGWLVVAAFTDEPVPTLPQTIAHLDAGWPRLRDVGLPALRRIVADSLPVSSRGSNQLLVIVRPDPPPGAAGITYGMGDGDAAYSMIEVKPNDAGGQRTPAGTLGLVFHEMTHAFQRQYANTGRAPGSGPALVSSAAPWALEGGAAMMERELARRVAGLGLLDDWDFRAAAPGAAKDYAAFANVGRGDFAVGYAASADFLLHLAEARAAAGEGVDEALAQVEHGAQEGWFGHGPNGDAAGLAQRMRARLGAPWEPAEALLDWTLSHAVDDRTASADLQDRAFLRSWDFGSTVAPWWTAHAELAPGSSPASVARVYESTGYFQLHGGGTYAITASVDGVRWKLVRFR